MSAAATEYSRNLPNTVTSTDPTYADILDFCVVQNPVPRAFAAHTRLLDAAEGRHLGGDNAGIEPHDAALNRFRHPPTACQIPRVNVGGQAKFSIVGERDSLSLRFEFEQGSDGSEGFFACHQHRLGDADKDCRLEECPPQRMLFAAEDAFGAVRNRVCNMFFD